MITLIDDALLDGLCAEAAASPRRRKNRNFHPADDHPAHRLLNAMQPDSYIPPHRHLDPDKDETFVVLRGALGVIVFDDAGNVAQATRVGQPSPSFHLPEGEGSSLPPLSLGERCRERGIGGAAIGVDIPHGTWHTAVALEADTVFLEAKAGPYLPLTEAERAPWAPAENSAEAAAYLAALKARIPA
ncbi:MAG: WbuC family cupin fold metalloprotein [Sulfuritalea sp.]|nr:WbuC family cupin fold metalloprotein [Sulfuritalea sp.]